MAQAFMQHYQRRIRSIAGCFTGSLLNTDRGHVAALHFRKCCTLAATLFLPCESAGAAHFLNDGSGPFSAPVSLSIRAARQQGRAHWMQLLLMLLITSPLFLLRPVKASAANNSLLSGVGVTVKPGSLSKLLQTETVTA